MKVKTVLRATQAPANASRWCLDLACGHEVWVTATRRPRQKQAACERCDALIEEGTVREQPAERDARTGIIGMRPEVSRTGISSEALAAYHTARVQHYIDTYNADTLAQMLVSLEEEADYPAAFGFDGEWPKTVSHLKIK